MGFDPAVHTRDNRTTRSYRSSPTKRETRESVTLPREDQRSKIGSNATHFPADISWLNSGVNNQKSYVWNIWFRILINLYNDNVTHTHLPTLIHIYSAKRHWFALLFWSMPDCFCFLGFFLFYLVYKFYFWLYFPDSLFIIFSEQYT